MILKTGSDIREAGGHQPHPGLRICAILNALVSGASLGGYRRVADVRHPAAIGDVSHDLQSLVFRQTLFAGPINEIATVVG
jgi:hypothetical protein